MVGKEGLEPSRLAARDPKSRLSASSSTSPVDDYTDRLEGCKDGNGGTQLGEVDQIVVRGDSAEFCERRRAEECVAGLSLPLRGPNRAQDRERLFSRSGKCRERLIRRLLDVRPFRRPTVRLNGRDKRPLLGEQRPVSREVHLKLDIPQMADDFHGRP